jgi:ankyrin repeat protein
MSELHIADSLDQPEMTKSILSQNLCNIHEIDENGDQPSRIAARLNHVECTKALIEYDAHMGRKNYCGLTPWGEAQMNGNKEIMALIKDNYTTNVPEQYIWHNEISRETAAWYDTWDDELRRLQWARLGKGSV